MEDRRLSAEPLERWVLALLENAGLASPAAATVAGTLVEASLRGVDSHGVERLPIYVERLRAGIVNTAPRPRVLRSEGALAMVDGDQGPGQVAAVFAAELSVSLAREHGVAAVAVRRSAHYGAAAYYVIRPARQGLLALCTSNSDPWAVPFGGRGRALGTNPVAFAAPSGRGVFVLDMATSQVAANRIFGALEEGVPIPRGWAVDERGEATTDPGDAYAMLPLGGYKGYGLALMVEILSGVLAGAGITHGVGRLHEDFDRPQDVGHFHLALDPERTVGRARFEELLEGLLAELKAGPPGPGHDEVLLPGEPEERARREREALGIPLPPPLWETLGRLSRELSVEVPL
jgi:ureidoglycolate dehydrogenase (NAD+)